MATIYDESGAAILDEGGGTIYDEAGAGIGTHTYIGPEPLVYVDLVDTVAVHTLVASPGMSYQIEAPLPALGDTIPPSDGHWSS